MTIYILNEASKRALDAVSRAGNKKATLSSEFDRDLVLTSTGTVLVEVETFGGDTPVHAVSAHPRKEATFSF